MIRAIHARGILDALSRAAEAGPVFYAINRCIHEIDLIGKTEETEANRSRLVEDLKISVRLANALRVREILTVRELESKTADELLNSSTGSARFFGKKMLRETREVLASLEMKLNGDPL